jgi:hypothetical protein
MKAQGYLKGVPLFEHEEVVGADAEGRAGADGVPPGGEGEEVGEGVGRGGGGACVCVCVCACVGVWVCVCMCVCLCVRGC